MGVKCLLLKGVPTAICTHGMPCCLDTLWCHYIMMQMCHGGTCTVAICCSHLALDSACMSQPRHMHPPQPARQQSLTSYRGHLSALWTSPGGEITGVVGALAPLLAVVSMAPAMVACRDCMPLLPLYPMLVTSILRVPLGEGVYLFPDPINPQSVQWG